MSEGKRGDASRVTADEFRAVLRDGLPLAAAIGFEVVSLTWGEAVVRSTARA